MTHSWDPDRYLTYADERGRPFVDLVGRVAAEAPRLVVDLGCGPGNLTALLPERWPGAEVVGVDSSEEMVAAAQQVARVRFEVGDLRTWTPPGPVATPLATLTSPAPMSQRLAAAATSIARAAAPARANALNWLISPPIELEPPVK